MLFTHLALVAAVFAAQAPGPQGKPAGSPHRPQAPQIAPMPADVEPVVTTASGLKYCVLKAGAPGESPKLGDKVVLHYTLWGGGGVAIESSRVGPKPAEAVVGDVVEGWTEALQMMTPGAHWKLVVPGALGYGERGNPPRIKSNETLTFEVELISFAKGPPLPPFHQGDPAKQKKTESGLVYEPIVEGNGTMAQADDPIELRYALFAPNGRMLDCSEKRGRNFRARAADMPMRVLQLAPQYLSVGARYRFIAPVELAPKLPWYGYTFLPTGSPTVWEVELVSIIPKPPFTKPDPAKQTTTASGLKYEVLKSGSGPLLKVGDKFTAQYNGWLTDGTLVDSSRVSDTPIRGQFKLTGLISGFIEGLQLMNAGALFRFEIPGQLGYGAQGKGPIPPNATLVFEIELANIGD